MSWRLAVMHGRPCLLPDNLSGLVDQLDQVLVGSSDCPFHTVGSLVHESSLTQPYDKHWTNARQGANREAITGQSGPDRVKTLLEQAKDQWSGRLGEPRRSRLAGP